MSGIELRPRFKIESKYSPEEIIQKICTQIKDKEAPCEGSIITNHVVLRLPDPDVHFWSPQLSIDVSEKINGSIIKGLFGPSPNVWTMFMFFYMGIGIFGLFGLFYGLSQWTIGNTPYALWSLPIAILAELLIYLIAHSGKAKAKRQMNQLNTILQKVLKK